MASGSSSGRANNPGSRSDFEFASDDVLGSLGYYDNRQESFNGSRSDPAIATGSSKDFHTTSMSRPSAFPTANVYAQPEGSLNQELITTVERTMKKHGDNLMRFLEGISSRLSQLEMYCYNLDKSIGEMRSDLAHHNGEADTKLKSMDKHLQEVHRSVQLLRDRQELAETQKEIAKLQIAEKESSRSKDKKSSTTSSETKNTEDGPEMHDQQLALALPEQAVPQPAPPSRTSEQTITQQPPYYLPAPQSQPPQSSYVPADSQYRAQQMVPNPLHGQVNQPPQVHQFPQYQQQWSHPIPQAPVQPAQPPLMQSQMQIRAPQSAAYIPYMQSQPPNPPLQEQMTTSMPMQVPAPGTPQPGVGQDEPMPFAFGGTGRPLQTQPPPPYPMKGGDGYAPSVSSGGSYMTYDGEGARFSQGGYPHPQPPTSTGLVIRGPSPGPPQFVQNHPYNDVIDKLVSMGYRGDHVSGVIQRLEESGQPVDFNAVLDRLNGHSSGGSQRSW